MKKKEAGNGWIVPVALLVGGGLFYAAIGPLVESLSNMAQQAINCRIAKWQFDIEEQAAEHNAAMELIKPNDSNMTQAVGFQIPSEEDMDYD